MKCPECSKITELSEKKKSNLDDESTVKCSACGHKDKYMNFCVRWTTGSVETLNGLIEDLRKSVFTTVEKYAESHDMRITAEMVIDAFVHECKDD
jgi:Zn ribbon nucleic-acid-binding protein